MSKPILTKEICDEFLEKIDDIDFESCGFDALASAYKKINEKRAALEKFCKALKAREDKIKHTILTRMIQQKLESVKTKSGHLSKKTVSSIITQDYDVFLEWLKNNPETMEVLSKKPYTQDKIKEYIGDDGTCPPGLDIYREIKLAIRKV